LNLLSLCPVSNNIILPQCGWTAAPANRQGIILENPEKGEDLVGLEDSLMDLHVSVAKLIRVIQANAAALDRGQDVLDKLPLLDFYNDDLLRNIENMRTRR
jgi:hypothetical protein